MDANTYSFGELVLLAVLGFALVFVVLVLLQFVVKLISKVFGKAEEEETLQEDQKAPAAVFVHEQVRTPVKAPAKQIPAKGSLGEIRLHGVEDQTAAILMAIVADEIGAPLNELRFLSIREIV